MGHSQFDTNTPADFGQHLVPPKLAADAAHSETVRSLRDELRALSAELDLERRQRAAAERTNRARMDLVARISHDIRTPLHAIAGYTDLLLSGVRGPLNAEQANDVERIQQSERHLVSLVGTILDYAKLEVGEMRFVLEEVPVVQLLEAGEVMIAPQLAARELTLEVLPASRQLRVLADADKVRRILVNLLTNAVKFTPPGERILLSAAADGAGIAIRVTDFGPGIPAEVLPAIFEPYVQLAPNASGATGLGLAIARDLALGMGGDVTVTSTVDMGSSFVLHLPSPPGTPRAPFAD
ncbi:MAG: hypothetical protein H0X64_01385 [Gemmatimonadaceae bacterium]|nr:hypothetical protein [Gemmatimonadaceae bacterium]